MRIIYGEEASGKEIEEAHADLMAELLEQIKFERAVDIVRKRNAGFDIPSDPLTDEALMVQAAAHLEMVMKESVREKTARRVGRPMGIDAETEQQIADLLRANPEMSKAEIAKMVGISRTSVYSCLKRMKKCSEIIELRSDLKS